MDTSNKPKTIATIDVNLVMPKVSKADWMQETINDHLQCVLCGSRDQVVFCRVSDGEELGRWPNGEQVQSLAFSADGNTLATVSLTGNVQLWSTKTDWPVPEVD